MLPKNLHYQNKIESAPARAYTTAIQPIAGTGNYTNGNTITINIPTTSNSVLVPSESYLKFDISGITGGAAASSYVRLDKAGAHGVIQRLRVLHGSQELENLDNYHVLVGQMLALQQSTDGANKLNILAGLNPSYLQNATTKETFASLVGDRLVPYGAAAANALAIGGNVPSKTFCINLMSLVGSLGADHYIPLFQMTASPLTIQIQLVSSALKFLCTETALVGGANATFTISNVEFMGSFIELSDQSISMINQSLGGSPLTYVVQSYANYTSNATLQNVATSVSHSVPAKYASLRSLFCIMRSQPDGAITFFSQSSTHFNVADWKIRIGSQLLPYKACSTMPEHFAELLKAIGSLSNSDHEPTINNYNYSTNSIAVASTETSQVVNQGTKPDSFALGFDLESYANADKNRIFAGMNTLNFDIYWNINHNAQTNANTPCRYDYYALYDNVLVFENGVCRAIR